MTTRRKALAVCGAVTAFGLGWIISEKFNDFRILSGMRRVMNDGFLKFGETVDGEFHELPADEWCKKVREYK